MAQCIYSSWQGKCSMYDMGASTVGMGCDEEGDCWAENDPDPGYSCEYFEDADPDEPAVW